MIELVDRRSYARKTFQRDDGQFVSRCHAGHIHYRHDVTGQLTDVDYTWVDTGAHWVIAGASYRLRVAKDFGAASLIEFQNRFNGASHIVTYDPRRLVWIANRNFNTATTIATQQSVQGVITGNTIRWTNAFGPGIHFELVRKRSGFTKDVVIDAFAALGTPPSGNTHVALILRYGGAGLAVKDEAGQTWDGATLFERSGRFTLTDAQNRPTFIAPATASDASDRRTAIPVAFVQRPEGLLQVKILTRALLNAAVYPLRADTTTTFYAGAGDGYCVTAYGAWDTAHDATASATANATAAEVRCAVEYDSGAGGHKIVRGFVPIDTSGLPDSDVISSATLYIWPEAVRNYDNDGDDWVNLVGPTSQASDTTVGTADYDQCGAIDNPAELSTRKDLSSLSTGAYTTYALNAAGLAAISVTGYTRLGLREGHDCIDSPTRTDINGDNFARFSSSEFAGTAQDPYLEVVHAPSAVVGVRGFPRGMFHGLRRRVDMGRIGA